MNTNIYTYCKNQIKCIYIIKNLYIIYIMRRTRKNNKRRNKRGGNTYKNKKRSYGRKKNGGRRRRRKRRGGDAISKMVLSAVVRWSRLRKRKFRKEHRTRKK